MRLTFLLLLISCQSFGQQVVSLCEDSVRTFTYSVSANQEGFWIWTMGDDTLSETNSVTITWNQEGSFDITVRFYNDCYLLPESYQVYVIECIKSALYFASAFTPNGDGKNDSWSPIGFGIVDVDWYIFDRWGLQIYEAHSPTDVWDGCMDYNGGRRPCQADVYVWLAYWHDSDYGFNSKTGRVTIVR